MRPVCLGNVSSVVFIGGRGLSSILLFCRFARGFVTIYGGMYCCGVGVYVLFCNCLCVCSVSSVVGCGLFLESESVLV